MAAVMTIGHRAGPHSWCFVWDRPSSSNVHFTVRESSYGRISLAVVSSFILNLILFVSSLPAQQSLRSPLSYLGQSPNGRFNFYNVGQHPTTPGQAWWVHYISNPIISGKNLYAPAVVDNGGTWHLYVGGWRDASDHDDRIYVTTTTDPTLSQGFSPLALAVDIGYYVAVNDPSVVQRDDHTWVMALTVGYRRKDWIAIITSTDGINWTPNQFTDASYEVNLTNATVAHGGRPSLLFNSSRNRWELYFDGRVNGVYSQYVAYSTEKIPKNFTLIDSVNDTPWFDADIKYVNGMYYAAYRRNDGMQPWPWKFWWGQSPNGRKFEEVGVLLEPDAGAPYDVAAVSNAGWAIDRFGKMRSILFGGASNHGVNDHKIGIAYPQRLVELRSNGNVWHGQRNALDPTKQAIDSKQFPTIDWVKVSDPGAAIVNTQVRPYTRGATFIIKR